MRFNRQLTGFTVDEIKSSSPNCEADNDHGEKEKADDYDSGDQFDDGDHVTKMVLIMMMILTMTIVTSFSCAISCDLTNPLTLDARPTTWPEDDFVMSMVLMVRMFRSKSMMVMITESKNKPTNSKQTDKDDKRGKPVSRAHTVQVVSMLEVTIMFGSHSF